MKTKTYNVYSFDELDEKTKQKAIKNLAEICVDHDWWDATYDDAHNVGLSIDGFDIYHKTIEMSFDSCSWDYVADKITENHGETCGTYKTAQRYIKEYGKWFEENKHNEDIDNMIDDKNEELNREFLRKIGEDYLSLLTREYDYLTSDEAIIETIKANGYEFTEDGKID